MSKARWANYIPAMRTHRTSTYYYPGSYGTGEGNRTWAIESFQDLNVQDKNGKKIDVGDFWPGYGQCEVFHKGILMTPVDQYTITSHTNSVDFAITFANSITIGDDDIVAISL